MNDRKNNIVGSIMLTVCAIIWGSSFVAQTTGAEYVGPFTFISLRSLLGGLSLLPVILITDAVKKKNALSAGKTLPKEDKKYLFLGGLACGVALCVASVLQQIGIDKGTEPGKAGFITAIYILLVPIFSIFLKKRIRPLIWLCVAISIGGLYLLCVNDSTVRASDMYVLACAVCFAIHILVIDYVSPHVNGIKLSAIQFTVCGLIAAVPMLASEEVTFELIKGAAVSIAYSGIMSSGVAYTLQILGQQKMKQPTIASMLMSLESVFSVLTGMVILKQIPTLKEATGCVLMFAAIIIAQLPEKKKESKKQPQKAEIK